MKTAALALTLTAAVALSGCAGSLEELLKSGPSGSPGVILNDRAFEPKGGRD